MQDEYRQILPCRFLGINEALQYARYIDGDFCTIVGQTMLEYIIVYKDELGLISYRVINRYQEIG